MNIKPMSTLDTLGKYIAGGIAILLGLALYYAINENTDFLLGRFGISFNVTIAQKIFMLFGIAVIAVLIFFGEHLRAIAVVALAIIAVMGNGTLYNKTNKVHSSSYPVFDPSQPKGKGFNFSGMSPKAFRQVSSAQPATTLKNTAQEWSRIAIAKGYKRTNKKLFGAQLTWCSTPEAQTEHGRINCGTGYIWTKK